MWSTRWVPLGLLGLCFWITAVYPWIISGYDLLEETLFISSSLNQFISNGSTMFLLFWQQKLGTKFAMMCFMLRSCIKVLDTVVFGIPESASTSHTLSCRSLLIAACTCSTFSGGLLVAGLPECGPLSTDSQPSLKHLCHTFIHAALVASSPKAFWIIWIVSMEKRSSLMQNMMQIHCSTHSVILNVMAT